MQVNRHGRGRLCVIGIFAVTKVTKWGKFSRVGFPNMREISRVKPRLILDSDLTMSGGGAPSR
jgi:hypothetical protein